MQVTCQYVDTHAALDTELSRDSPCNEIALNEAHNIVTHTRKSIQLPTEHSLNSLYLLVLNLLGVWAFHHHFLKSESSTQFAGNCGPHHSVRECHFWSIVLRLKPRNLTSAVQSNTDSVHHIYHILERKKAKMKHGQISRQSFQSCLIKWIPALPSRELLYYIQKLISENCKWNGFLTLIF